MVRLATDSTRKGIILAGQEIALAETQDSFRDEGPKIARDQQIPPQQNSPALLGRMKVRHSCVAETGLQLPQR
jgi:hypothetical protein